MSSPPSAVPPFTILLVCTGNICRSAMAERLARAFLDEALGQDAHEVVVASAGTQAVVGSAMHPDSALVLRGFGAGAGDFRARQLVKGMADEADLTLTMTRGHRDEVLRRSPRVMARTFTLREAADLLGSLDGGPHDGASLPGRARELVRTMAAARSHRRGGPDDDIRDPVGEPLEVHDEVAETIVESLVPLLRRIVELHTD